MSIAEHVHGSSTGTRSSQVGRRTFRADIQALRALAVMLVVLNHLWPNRLTGGYVGVDVFFVISGFLISSHLLKELTSTGRLRLGAFYARRIRRLLPAAFLVLAASLVASMVWLPFSRWASTAHEVLASTLYAENWILAAKSVDYSASAESATVAQHYWSLSVEEQFYLLWPLLLLGLFRLGARGRLSRVGTLIAGMSVVTALGLVASVVITSATPNQAYFVTPVRTWEFGAGALAAMVAGRLPIAAGTARLAGLAGFASIAAAAMVFDDATAFPGWVALVPVLGTALVIVAGSDGRTPVLQGVLRWPLVQYLGNVSYSLYLWHWPLVVIVPFALDRPLSTIDKLVVLLSSVLLAGATKTFVEDRGQRWRVLTASTERTFVAMVVGMALLSGMAAAQLRAADVQEADARRTAAAIAASPCHGPQALLPGARCADPFGRAAVPVMSKANQYWNRPKECGDSRDELMSGDTRTHLVCDFSGGRAETDVVWLVGDSHGQQWQNTIFALGKARHWVVKTAFLGGCPVADVAFKGYNGSTDQAKAQACVDWATRVTDAVASDRPDIVFTSTYARRQAVDDGSGRSQAAQFATGLDATWKRWTDAGAMVYVLADPPLNQAVRPADCVALHADDPRECAVDRARAQPVDPLADAARASSNRRVRLIDLTDLFCTDQQCFAVVGGVSVYFDRDHLNKEYAELLAPMVLDRMS